MRGYSPLSRNDGKRRPNGAARSESSRPPTRHPRSTPPRPFPGAASPSHGREVVHCCSMAREAHRRQAAARQVLGGLGLDWVELGAGSRLWGGACLRAAGMLQVSAAESRTPASVRGCGGAGLGKTRRMPWAGP